MTEEEWFAATPDPEAMQRHVRSANVSLRRLQLFVVACGDAIGNEMTFEARAAFEALRQTAEGTANRKHKKRLAECGPLAEWLGWIIRTAGHARAVHEVAVARAGEVFGNPFRPVRFSPEWRTETAVLLARQMYASRDFGAMPILADALQDAGCDSDDVLDHCRATSATHVRGCWVTDLVLGKT